MESYRGWLMHFQVRRSHEEYEIRRNGFLRRGRSIPIQWIDGDSPPILIGWVPGKVTGRIQVGKNWVLVPKAKKENRK